MKRQRLKIGSELPKMTYYMIMLYIVIWYVHWNHILYVVSKTEHRAYKNRLKYTCYFYAQNQREIQNNKT